MKLLRLTTKYILPTVFAVVALGGCENSDDEPAAGRDYPEFSATLGQVESRVSGTSWDVDDEIGISTGEFSNICHITKAGDGKFTVKDADSQIKFQDDNEVEFAAYYPWTELTGGVEIKADTKEQSGQKAFDFLWAEAKGSKNEPNVKFNFSHKMTKLLISVKCGNGVTYETLKKTKLSLSGFRHAGSFNIKEGTTSVEGDFCDEWSFSGFAQNDDGREVLTFQLIFFPQEFDNPLTLSALFDGRNNALTTQIDFTASNKGKDGDSAGNEWVAGRQYNLSVTLCSSEVVFSDCTISPWNLIDDHEEVKAI